MSTQANPTIVGAFVVGAIVLVVAGVLVFGSGELFTQKTQYILYFEGSLKGLTIGAPVNFKGMRVGKVTDIFLEIDEDDFDIRTAVIMELGEGRLRSVGTGEVARKGSPEEAQEFLRHLVNNGLRAQLKMQSLVTGQLAIELDFAPNSPVKLVGTNRAYPEFPTISSKLEEFTKKIEEIPVRELSEAALNTLQNLDRFIGSPKTQGLPDEATKLMQETRRFVKDAQRLVGPIDGTLRETRALVRNVNSRVGPVVSSVEQTAESARATLDQGRETLAKVDRRISSDSALMYELRATLKALKKAAESVDALAEYLERHPEAVIRGKEGTGG